MGHMVLSLILQNNPSAVLAKSGPTEVLLSHSLATEWAGSLLMMSLLACGLCDVLFWLCGWVPLMGLALVVRLDLFLRGIATILFGSSS